MLTSAEIREAIEPQIYAIIAAIRHTIELVPPELMADLLENGLTLTGGGAYLKGLDRRIAEKMKVPVKIAANALSAVAQGASTYLSCKKPARRRSFLTRHGVTKGTDNIFR